MKLVKLLAEIKQLSGKHIILRSKQVSDPDDNIYEDFDIINFCGLEPKWIEGNFHIRNIYGNLELETDEYEIPNWLINELDDNNISYEIPGNNECLIIIHTGYFEIIK